jgi:8-amino-7-oxononanoate synthase
MGAEAHGLAADHPSGFLFPAEYAALKRTFETTDESSASDLFYQTFEGTNGSRARLAGSDTELINFCSYDYIGMSCDPEVQRAAQDAIATYGTSVSASRLVSGQRSLHRDLERTLADWLGAEDAITFVSGFATNADTIGHLMGPEDLIVYDALVHASIRQGIRLSGATARPFRHGDLDALEKILKRGRGTARQILIVVEGVYSMDGDIPDLPRLVELKRRYGTLLMVDEAHSMGVIGETGRGISEHWGVAAGEVDLWMGTLSKAFASCGGYIAGSRDLVTYLRHTAPGFVYSVGLSPAHAAAALTALRLLARQPERVQLVRSRSQLFHDLALERGLDTGNANRDAAVIPLMTGEPKVAAYMSRYMLGRGILALPIGFPAVPRNRTRLRFFVSSRHSEDDIRAAIEAMADGLAELRGAGA